MVLDIVCKRILIVDDEEDLCEILQYNLCKKGYYTEIAYSAEEALKRSPEQFDLILLDVMMGTMSGFEFACKLRNELKTDVFIIFLTAKNTENDINTGFKLGADDYITKPFSINTLTDRVNILLKNTSAENQKVNNSIRLNGINLDDDRKSIMINDKH